MQSTTSQIGTAVEGEFCLYIRKTGGENFLNISSRRIQGVRVVKIVAVMIAPRMAATQEMVQENSETNNSVPVSMGQG